MEKLDLAVAQEKLPLTNSRDASSSHLHARGHLMWTAMTKGFFHCTPAVNRLYASVILHTRLSEEKSGDEDKRYSRNHPPPIPTFLICFFSFFIEQPIFLWEATHEHNIGNKKKNFQETRCEVNPLPLLLSIQGN